MKKSLPAADPEAYVAALRDWQRPCVEALRSTVLASAALVEVIKWRNIVFMSNGPVLMIRAEEKRVLLGFWRGQRLVEIDPRLKPGGKYEMATIELHAGESVKPTVVRRLVKEAVGLNAALGDPTEIDR